jgi:uncharacterized protein YjbI with pentapeptide repeats
MTHQRQSPREAILQRYSTGERRFKGEDFDAEVVDLRGVVLVGADFSRCFLNVDFRGADLTGCLFENGNVKCCDFRGAKLTGASFRNSAIDGAEFDREGLAVANFEGATEQGCIYGHGEKPIRR